ncbi:IS6 family transposase, partial [Bacillus cereus]
QSFHTETKTLAGIEAMHMIRKGQTFHGKKSVQKQIQLINILFGLTA